MNINFKLFSEQEIIDTYEKHVVKDKSYYTKANDEYKKLSTEDKEKLFSTDFPRVASLFDYKEWIEKYNLKSPESLLSTFRGDLELQYINPNNITYFEYKGNGDGDLHTLNLGEKDFDFIIFNEKVGLGYFSFVNNTNILDKRFNWHSTVSLVRLK